MRIVSLIASGTEIVAALGQAEKIVGRSHGCDFPALVKHQPVLTEAKCLTDGNSSEIDRSVREILELSTSVYKVDIELLKQLKPDVIVTQTQCEICAVSLKDLHGFLKDELSHQVDIVNLNANSLSDFYHDIEKVASALQVETTGRELIQGLRNRMDTLETTLAGLPAPKVICLGWLDPLMTSGNWIPELVQKANAEELLAKPMENSYVFQFERLLELQPEFLIVMPCGFPIERTEQETAILTSHNDWNRLRCVQDRKVFIVDGHSYFNRPAPRLLDSLEILAEILHPGKTEEKHKLRAWKPLY